MLVVPNTRLVDDLEVRRRMFQQLGNESGSWKEWCDNLLKPIVKHSRKWLDKWPDYAMQVAGRVI